MVALSSNGNVVAVGSPASNSSVGNVWIFNNYSGSWQADNNNSPLISFEQEANQEQGFSLSLSADGATLAAGIPGYNEGNGAVSVWERKGNLNSPWVETSRLTGYGNMGNASIGISVAMSSDGKVIYASGMYDSSNTGAVWRFVKSGAYWTQQGSLLMLA